MATPIDVIVFKCVKIRPIWWEIGEIVHYSHGKKQHFGSLSNCHYCVDRAQNLPGPAPTSKSVPFWRSYSRTREDRSITP